MSKLIRVLHVDDTAADRELVRDALEREHGGFEVVQAGSRQELEVRLAEGPYDVVLSDFNILGFKGLEVIDLAREKAPGVPVIIVTGTGSEAIAVEAMKRGAIDYVIKTPDHIRRLPFTIEAVRDKTRLLAERDRAEERALRFSHVLEGSLNEIYVFDAETLHFVDVNRGARENIGYSIEELRSLTPLDLKPEQTPESFAKIIEPLRSGTEEKIHFTTVHQRKDGSLYPVEIHLQFVAGGPPVFVAIILDITERKRAEEALRDSERFLLESQSVAHLGSYVLDIPSGAWKSSPTLDRIFGIGERYEHSVEGWVALVHPDDQNSLADYFAHDVIEKRGRFDREYRIVRRDDGAERWVHGLGRLELDAQGLPVRMLGTIQDITERRQARDALTEAVSIVTRSPAVAFLWKNEEGWPVEFVSENVERLFGYSAQEFTEEKVSYLKLIHSEDLERVARVVTSASNQKGMESFTHRPYRIITKSGDSKWIEDTSHVRRDALGTITHYEGIVYDVTERKKAEEDRERLAVAIDQVREAVVITDSEGSIQYVNPAFEAVTGYTRAEAIGQNPRVLKSGEHEDAFYAEMWDTLLRGESWSGRMVNKRKDGTLFTEEAIISPVRDSSGQTVNYVAVKRDITEKIVLEQQFRQAQKMESVGRLAGGVAHDFNNMLGVILGNAEMAMEQMDPNQPLYANLTEICTAAQRSAGLTRQLLAFARKQTVAPKVLELNHTVEGMLKMLRRLIGEDIDLAWLPGAKVWPVKVDPSQIDQILANLCVNARDAIEDVGKITIETDNISFDQAYCADHPGFVPGEFALLAVSDDGSGMDKEVLANLYEPFFTTKEQGKGTGLGLATVYGIVKQNDGFINVYSEPGQGTTFKVYLRRHAAKVTPMQKKAPAGSIERGHETILLVEDEPAILTLTTRMLEGQGYTVLAASRPGEAIHLAETHPGEIDLLLTDVVMPEMNGRDLARNLLSYHPNLKRLFTSGYTANVIAHQGVLDEGVHFIQKPFGKDDLVAKVQEVLKDQ